MSDVLCAVRSLDQTGPLAPILLSFDSSFSLRGEIGLLNEGLVSMRADLRSHPLTREQAKVGLVTFGGEVEVVHDFLPPDELPEYRLEASGRTPMGQALEFGLAALRQLVAEHRAAGLGCHRPTWFICTDGLPTDDWRGPASLVAQAERAGEFNLFAFGTDDADFDVLRQVSTVRPPMRLLGACFIELFQFISQSIHSVAMSRPGDQVRLPRTDGWASVDTGL